MYHKALKTAMFRNLFITIGPSIFSFSSSINFRTSSCKDSSIVDLPNPKSLRFLKRNLLYSCQYFPYEKECNLQSVKMFLSYLLYLAQNHTRGSISIIFWIKLGKGMPSWSCFVHRSRGWSPRSLLHFKNFFNVFIFCKYHSSKMYIIKTELVAMALLFSIE